MGVGYYLNKKRVFTEEVSQKLSYFVVNIAMPLMIVTSLNNTEIADKGELLRYILTGACFYLVIPFLAKVISILIQGSMTIQVTKLKSVWKSAIRPLFTGSSQKLKPIIP